MLNTNEHIVAAADELLKDAGTGDPHALASFLGIEVRPIPFKKQKGVYKLISGQPYIFIKEDLDEVSYKMVLLHEIGHDMLHRDAAGVFFDQTLFDTQNSRMEYEANLFAAHILITDEDVLECVGREMDISQAAGYLRVDSNLLGLKISDMIRRGYDFRRQESRSDFLKD